MTARRRAPGKAPAATVDGKPIAGVELIPGLGAEGDIAATWWAIGRVKRWAKNPRVNAHVVPKVARSIKRFGFGAPLVCRSDGTLIAGETRWKAAQLLGLPTVPVRVMDHLSDAEAVALGIADNKLAELSKWDDPVLTELARDELAPAGYGVEELVDVVGFSELDARALLGHVEPASGPGGKLDFKVEITCPHCGQKFQRT